MPRSIPIRSCTCCGALFRSPRREAPPFLEAYRPTEEPVRATRCTSCGSFLWVADAPTVGELPMDALYPVWDVALVDLGAKVDMVQRALVAEGHGRADPGRMPMRVARSVSRDAAVVIARRFEEAGAVVRMEPSHSDPRFREWAELAEAKPLTAAEAARALEAGLAETPSRVTYLRSLSG